MTLQLLHSEFPDIWGKFDFLFYQCRLTVTVKNNVHSHAFTVTHPPQHSTPALSTWFTYYTEPYSDNFGVFVVRPQYLWVRSPSISGFDPPSISGFDPSLGLTLITQYLWTRPPQYLWIRSLYHWVRSQYLWARSQYLSTQWNLKGGRKSSVE